jgi:chromosome segregation ATPase
LDADAGHTVTVTFLEWLLQPVVAQQSEIVAQLDRMEETQKTLDRKLDDVMAQVRVNQEDLESLDQGLDEATAALTAKIEALNLPEGDFAALL